MTINRSAFLAGSLLSISCADVDSPPTEAPASAARTWTDGTPEALGLLAFVNEGTTTITLLDDQVGLDLRAAKAIVAYRDGSDVLPGTPDDDLYGDIAELDARYYVGAAALEALYAYADLHGYVAQGQDLLGTWDGVSFTVDEANATISWVNVASEATLDDALDSRAVDSIVDARPIDTVEALSELGYVGGSALADIKDLALGEDLTCTSDADCTEAEHCMGIPHDGSSSMGACADPSTTDWMVGTFANPTDAAIGSAVSSSIVVTGLAEHLVDAQVTLDISHGRPADLIVTLTDPSGGTSTLWNRTSSPSFVVVADGLPASDDANGRWTINVRDVVSGYTGTLRGWTLDLASE